MSTPMCSANHCSGVSQQVNDTCKANGWPIGHLVLVCDFSTGACCNCTCSCFAWGTKIAIPDDNVKNIQDFIVGDKVLACGPDLKWETSTVEFSHGTGANSRQPLMQHLIYGEDRQELIVTMDHLFLMPEGKLKRADKLIIGQDFLVSPEGLKVAIHSIEVGLYIGGVHHIATSVGKPTSLDGHLLSSQGVVSADYAVQTYYEHGELENETFLVKNHEKLPQAKNQEGAVALKISPLGHSDLLRLKTEIGSRFIPKSALKVTIPDRAKRFFTELQAKELGLNAPLYPIGYAENQQAVLYLEELFGTFYPDIKFLTDFYSEDFNAYSWIEENQMVVVVAGGLTRVQCLDLAGFALIIAHEVGHLLGSDDKQTLACEGKADYYGVADALRKVFFQSLFTQIYMDSLNQIEKAFSYIKKERGKDGSCDNLSLDCRFETYKAAGSLTNIPECAGGPPLLSLEKAENTKDGVLLSFNVSLNAGTAQTIDNYQVRAAKGLSKKLPVQNAIYSNDRPKEVILTVNNLIGKKEYTVLVSDLYSAQGNPLNPKHNKVSFIA